MHDSEHSLEAIVYWLAHGRPDLEILPVIVAEASFERFETLAAALAEAVSAVMQEKGLLLGRDVAVVISTDGVHYGADFHHTPFGDGGEEAYERAVSRDVALLTGPLRGRVTTDKARELFETFVDPAAPATYRLTWCGRFSVPFGLLFLERLAERVGAGAVTAHPLAYATSISAPELELRNVGLAETAPASTQHFVGYPAVALTTRFSGGHSR
jgi:AmmeMemoRadiSam system protein B